MTNPTKRRRARRTTKRAASSAGRVLRHRRRNPVGGLGDFLSGQLMPSAIGGGGALLLDVALAALPIPAAMKTGPMAPVVKIAGAVGIGAIANAVTSRRVANQIAAGALTVTMYQIARSFLARTLPAGSLPGLSGPFFDPLTQTIQGPDDGSIGEYVNAPPQLLPDGTVGAYIGDPPDLGYINSGVVVGADPNDMSGYDDVSGFETGVYR